MKHTLHYLSTHFGFILGPALLLALGSTETQAQTVSFAPAVLYPTSFTQPTSVATADINGDGKLDLLTADSNTTTIGLALNKGNGTFITGQSVPAGGRPNGLALADLNGDGKTDIVTTVEGIQIAVLLGLGGGAFTAPVTYPIGSSSFTCGGKLVLADVNSDGKLDIVTACFHDGSVSVLLGLGMGTFGAGTRYGTGKSSTGLDAEPWAVAVGDLNGDGRPDIVATDIGYHSLCVLLATSTGFGPVTHYTIGTAGSTIGTGFPNALRLTDVDGDGKLDILVANAASDDLIVMLNPGAGGAFQISGHYALGPVNSEAKDMTLVDINGDGHLDVATANSGSNSTGVLLATGTGTFKPVVVVKASNYASGATVAPAAITAGDFNGDGKPDLAIANDDYNSPISILLNLTASTLATSSASLGAMITLSPNPASDVAMLHLQTAAPQVARLTVTLHTVMGAVVSQQEVAVERGETVLPIATAALPAGLYVVQLKAYDAGGQLVGTIASQRLCVVR